MLDAFAGGKKSEGKIRRDTKRWRIPIRFEALKHVGFQRFLRVSCTHVIYNNWLRLEILLKIYGNKRNSF